QTVERSGCYRVPSPTADRWALALRITPGEWQKATVNISRLGFETLARRDPMHLETELFPLGPGMADRDVLPIARQAKELARRRAAGGPAGGGPGRPGGVPAPVPPQR